MTSRVEHTDVGAYALGLLDEDDRLAFEAHLLGCNSCRYELHELSGVANVLNGIGPVEDPYPLPVTARTTWWACCGARRRPTGGRAGGRS
ncbi:zf-HC2 domain-containing protein [Nonomuraea salmonea]|uniref:anti-sigma factor family protein n=1 Tax=Nonomuraea salmonea TaxID=46181 RepID=UPI002FEAE1DE